MSSFLEGDANIHQQLALRTAVTNEDSVVKNLMTERQHSLVHPNTHSSIPDQVMHSQMLTPESPHRQETIEGQINYIDRGHWLSILDDIKEVREHLNTTGDVASHDSTQYAFHRGNIGNQRSDARFLFHWDGHPTLEEVLKTLPPRSVCDMLLSWYFNCKFQVLGEMKQGRPVKSETAVDADSKGIVHPTKFHNEVGLASTLLLMRSRSLMHSIKPFGSRRPRYPHCG